MQLILQPGITLWYIVARMNLNSIRHTILDETSSPAELRNALNSFVQLCSDVSGIQPDPSFDAWAEDSLLESGVAINPQAAAHCAVDYRRSVAFIRGVYAALNKLISRFPDTPIQILYAGCGPFATLLLPLLGKFHPGDLKINLLDIHQRSLDSVELLLAQFEFSAHDICTIKDDACHYTHPEKLHLIIAETMQKALEQEPQFSVTANLAPQLQSTGIFVPQCIEVALCLADLKHEKEQLELLSQIESTPEKTDYRRYPLGTVCTLSPEHASEQLQEARYNAHTKKLELPLIEVTIPTEASLDRFDAVLLTRICIFEDFCLEEYESEITLPLKCHELAPLTSGSRYRVSYQLGSYPKFTFALLHEE